MGEQITKEILEEFIYEISKTHKPTKENPLYWWVKEYCFKNDGQQLHIVLDYEKQEYRAITPKEYLDIIKTF